MFSSSKINLESTNPLLIFDKIYSSNASQSILYTSTHSLFPYFKKNRKMFGGAGGGAFWGFVEVFVQFIRMSGKEGGFRVGV